MRYYGIDVGGTTVKIGLFEDGVLTEKFEIPTDTRDGGKNILPDIAAALGPADGAGLAVPGPVTAEGVVNGCVNLGWGVFSPAQTLTELTGIPARCCNDANAATLGEQWKGGGQGCDSVLLVTLGTGVGAGLVLDGKLLAGAHGAAGELGHLCVRPEETLVCGCGGRGCLEQYASATGLSRLAREAGLGELSAKELLDRAKGGDAAARAVTEEAFEILGRALAAACCTADPDAVVLGGGVSHAGEYLRARVEEYFQKYTFHACRSTKILLAELGNDAGMYGAARLVME